MSSTVAFSRQGGNGRVQWTVRPIFPAFRRWNPRTSTIVLIDTLCSRKVTPTGVATGLDIGLSNLSLKMITLSFYSESAVRSDYRKDGRMS